jgi:hypothetical protein
MSIRWPLITRKKKVEMKGLLQLFLGLILFQFVHAQKDCRHGEYEQQMIAAHPEMTRSLLAIDALSSVKAKNQSGNATETVVPEIITIPVVIHILYNTADQNLSNEQVMSQIDALNRDFSGANADRKKTPAYFTYVAANCGIQFKLATKDPVGMATTGIVRKPTSIQNFGLDDRAKTSSRGGDDAWDASRYLNIWVCNIAGGVLGYSSTPGGPVAKDGVVISLSAFGTVGKVSAPFNLGRTATHEIGHWLNLRHIWGDTYCGDDKVDDTPQQRSSNRGCPSGKKYTCGTEKDGEMYMNFMDLTDDACMFLFTNGQKQRMRSLFEPGGARHSLLSSTPFDTFTKSPEDIQVTPVEAPVEKVAVKLFPNPVSNVLSLAFQQEQKDDNNKKELVIYNHTGKPVIKEVMTGSQKSFNISHLNAGLYYIHIIEGNSRTIRKFMKL